jgi:TonB family protein
MALAAGQCANKASPVIAALLLALSAMDTVPAVRAHADLGSYFHDNDYPVAAAQRAEAGTVAFTLEIDATGRVAACHVTATSGSQALDDATCQILTARAQFTPARDAAGAAVPDQVSARVTWELPARPAGASFASYVSDTEYPAEALRRGEQGLVEFALDVSPQGRVANCRVTRSSGSAVLDAATCRLMTVRARFQPGLGPDGRPVADTVRGHIRWVLPD